MRWRSQVVAFGQEKLFPIGGLCLSAASLLAPISGNQIATRIIPAAGVIGVTLVVTGYSKYLAPSIQITCIPLGEEHSAKAQHQGKCAMSSGLAEMEVYVDLPEYQSDPEVNININNSVDLAAWDYPEDIVEFSESYGSFKTASTDNFSFSLELSGDAAQLDGNVLKLEFEDALVNRVVQVIKVEPQ